MTKNVQVFKWIGNCILFYTIIGIQTEHNNYYIEWLHGLEYAVNNDLYNCTYT